MHQEVLYMPCHGADLQPGCCQQNNRLLSAKSLVGIGVSNGTFLRPASAGSVTGRLQHVAVPTNRLACLLGGLVAIPVACSAL